MTVDVLDEVKERSRAAWAAGDYDAIAQQLWGVGELLVGHAGVQPGEDVLDIACGTGNATVRAAQAGGQVVGLDLTPELFPAARAHAAEAGVELALVEGDAEDLPFDDESFDVVLSCFGCLWVPRHAVTAAEIVRVLRPGGRFALTNWIPEGGFGTFARTMASHLPPPPDIVDPAPLWGDESYVRELFAQSGVELEFVRETVVWRYASAEDALNAFATQLGPIVKARELLEPAGRWTALQADVAAWMADRGTDAGDGFTYSMDYLVTLGRRTG